MKYKAVYSVSGEQGKSPLFSAELMLSIISETDLGNFVCQTLTKLKCMSPTCTIHHQGMRQMSCSRTTEGQGCQVFETKSAQLQIQTSQNVCVFSPWFSSPLGLPSIKNRFNPQTKKNNPWQNCKIIRILWENCKLGKTAKGLMRKTSSFNTSEIILYLLQLFMYKHDK